MWRGRGAKDFPALSTRTGAVRREIGARNPFAVHAPLGEARGAPSHATVMAHIPAARSADRGTGHDAEILCCKQREKTTFFILRLSDPDRNLVVLASGELEGANKNGLTNVIPDHIWRHIC